MASDRKSFSTLALDPLKSARIVACTAGILVAAVAGVRPFFLAWLTLALLLLGIGRLSRGDGTHSDQRARIALERDAANPR
jgi:hypothetical protein